ncbi:MAG: hypothetical protein R3C40_07605 [Parvularculaceae bacterium]
MRLFDNSTLTFQFVDRRFDAISAPASNASDRYAGEPHEWRENNAENALKRQWRASPSGRSAEHDVDQRSKAVKAISDAMMLR